MPGAPKIRWHVHLSWQNSVSTTSNMKFIIDLPHHDMVHACLTRLFFHSEMEPPCMDYLQTLGSNMDVSENNGTPKSSILIGFSIINHPFWGTPVFGNIHMATWTWRKVGQYIPLHSAPGASGILWLKIFNQPTVTSRKKKEQWSLKMDTGNRRESLLFQPGV